MTEEKKAMESEKKGKQSPGKPGKETETKKKKPPADKSFGSIKMWWGIMFIYLLLFGYIGYIAFWPMAFNDPDNTVKKYLMILNDYQSKSNTTDAEEGKILKLAMEELMKKAEEAAGDMQELASQSFNIVLGAFLAFLSATVTMLFQGSGGKKKEEAEPEEPEEEIVTA